MQAVPNFALGFEVDVVTCCPYQNVASRFEKDIGIGCPYQDVARRLAAGLIFRAESLAKQLIPIIIPQRTKDAESWCFGVAAVFCSIGNCATRSGDGEVQ
jgi:hypothetical protein